MELIDTHCHLTFEPLAGDIDGIIERSKQAGVRGWIVVGTKTADNRQAVELANRYEGMYAAVGIHPHYAKDARAEDIEELKRLAQREKVVALGETGLDFHYNFSDKESQKELFSEHLRLAGELELPVIIHSREAFGETMEVLERFAGIRRVVFHCFGGTAEEAKAVLTKGYFISFTGVVTFKGAEKARGAAMTVPLERLMLETDCPYMSPEPMRKQKVNEPALLVHTARFVADLKGIEPEEFAARVTATSKGFFSLPL